MLGIGQRHPLTGRGDTSGGRPRSAVELGPQGRHLRLRVGERPLEAGPAAEGGGAGRCPYTDPVVGDPDEGHLAGHEECRHAPDEEILQEIGLGHLRTRRGCGS